MFERQPNERELKDLQYAYKQGLMKDIRLPEEGKKVPEEDLRKLRQLEESYIDILRKYSETNLGKDYLPNPDGSGKSLEAGNNASNKAIKRMDRVRQVLNPLGDPVFTGVGYLEVAHKGTGGPLLNLENFNDWWKSSMPFYEGYQAQWPNGSYLPVTEGRWQQYIGYQMSVWILGDILNFISNCITLKAVNKSEDMHKAVRDRIIKSLDILERQDSNFKAKTALDNLKKSMPEILALIDKKINEYKGEISNIEPKLNDINKRLTSETLEVNKSELKRSQLQLIQQKRSLMRMIKNLNKLKSTDILKDIANTRRIRKTIIVIFYPLIIAAKIFMLIGTYFKGALYGLLSRIVPDSVWGATSLAQFYRDREDRNVKDLIFKRLITNNKESYDETTKTFKLKNENDLKQRYMGTSTEIAGMDIEVIEDIVKNNGHEFDVNERESLSKLGKEPLSNVDKENLRIVLGKFNIQQIKDYNNSISMGSNKRQYSEQDKVRILKILSDIQEFLKTDINLNDPSKQVKEDYAKLVFNRIVEKESKNKVRSYWLGLFKSKDDKQRDKNRYVLDRIKNNKPVFEALMGPRSITDPYDIIITKYEEVYDEERKELLKNSRFYRIFNPDLSRTTERETSRKLSAVNHAFQEIERLYENREKIKEFEETKKQFDEKAKPYIEKINNYEEEKIKPIISKKPKEDEYEKLVKKELSNMDDDVKDAIQKLNNLREQYFGKYSLEEMDYMITNEDRYTEALQNIASILSANMQQNAQQVISDILDIIDVSKSKKELESRLQKPKKIIEDQINSIGMKTL